MKGSRKIKIATCARVSCDNTFIKKSGAQKFCEDCKTPGATYDPLTDRFYTNGGSYESAMASKEGLLVSMGTYHKDFRTTICKSFGKQCKHFTECSDSLYTSRNGFKYQTNGNIDCYEAPKIRLASGYNSIAACSINDRCR